MEIIQSSGTSSEYIDYLRFELASKALGRDPQISYDEWAEKYYQFPKGDRHPGRYRLSRTPYAREILYELSPMSPATKVVFIKPTQVGATTLSNILLSAIPHAFAAHCLFVFPTVKMAEKHVKKKLSKAWAAIPELKGIIKDSRGDKSGNTMMYREFPGGSISIAGAGAVDAQRSDSAQIICLTDIDSPEFKVDGEGDALEVFYRRADAYGPKKKIYVESTPLVKGASLIEIEYEKSSMGRYHLPCPCCGFFHFLEFGGKGDVPGFKFSRNQHGRPTKAWFVCPKCGQEFEEKRKFQAMIDGKYVHQFPDRPDRGFMINAFYSPAGMVSWLQIANEWIDSHKHPAKRQVFVNTREAKSFEMPGSIKLDGEILKESAENYPLGFVPAAAQCVAMGVDTHDNRLDVVIMAFNIAGESWVIGWQSLWGDPDAPNNPENPNCWAALDELRSREWQSESGDKTFKSISCAIDMMGHRTDAVKNYVRTRAPNTIAVQGARTNFAPILGGPKDQDLFYDGHKIKGGIQAWPVGTNEVKHLIFGQLTSTETNLFHLSSSLPLEFFLQLTAEKFDPIAHKYVPCRPGGANHALDCVVYAIAGVSRVLNIEKMKQHMRERKAAPQYVKADQPVPVAARRENPVTVRKESIQKPGGGQGGSGPIRLW